jgi:uncharacterized protein (DUF362 family)
MDGDGFHFVAVRKGDDGYALAREVLSALSLDPGEFRGRRILLKPNAGRMAPPHTGIDTNPEVVAAAIDFFREAGCSDIVVAESPILGVQALAALEKCGIADVARARGVPLIDLDAAKPVTVAIPGGRVVQRLRICKEVLENNYLVSIPVMKTHMHTQVSLGLKNMKGCLYEREKVRLHQLPHDDSIVHPVKPLDVAISDMARVLMPDLVLIDGTIAQEGLGPAVGEAKRAGIVLASRNCLAADCIGIELMGFDPGRVHHVAETLRMLAVSDERYDFSRHPIVVDPAGYPALGVAFLPPPQKISLEYANVTVEDKESCSACLSTVLMFLKRYYAEYADYLSPERPLRISIGKGVGQAGEDSLLIGNCTLKKSDCGVFIKGCPPVASDIRHEVDRILGLKR